MSEPSVAVEVTVRVKSASESAGGVMVRPESWPWVRVQVPSPLSVPADRLAPVGTPETTTDRLSEPSVSVSAEVMSRVIAVSSLPETSLAVTVGASATALTATLKVSTV